MQKVLTAVVTQGTVNRIPVVNSTAEKLPWVLRYRGVSGHTCTIAFRENTEILHALFYKNQ